MKLTNPSTDRPLIASIEGSHYEIAAGGSVDIDDYVIASTLVEHGAKAIPVELQAARELWAERNRGINSKTASASASEGAIIGRQQSTVNVATGTMEAGVLAGSALAEAVKEANAAGAEIGSRLSADEKRDALAVWQTQRGASSPPGQTMGDRFEVDDHGDLKLDDDGQPIPLVDAAGVDPTKVVVPVDDEDFDLEKWVGDPEDVATRRLRADAILEHYAAMLADEAIPDEDKLTDEQVAALREKLTDLVGDGVDGGEAPEGDLE